MKLAHKNKIGGLEVAFIIFFCLILSGTTALPNIIKFTYHFDPPQIHPINDEYQLVHFENSFQTGIPGEPTLPVHPVMLYLTPGNIAKNIKINYLNKKEVSEKVTLAPRQLPQTFSQPKPLFLKNANVYSQETPIKIPQPKIETHFYHGHPIAMTCITPVEYVPAMQKLAYFSEVTVELEITPDERAVNALENLSYAPNVVENIHSLVANKNEIHLVASNQNPVSAYDYLIITIEDFLDDYQPLVDFYNLRGIRTRIYSLELIKNDFTGQDEPEMIRNFIIDEYRNHGIQFLLLAGDADDDKSGEMQIPVRKLYGEAHSSEIYTEQIPSDLYYAALDGNWNENGDDKWGEPGEDDLLPELAVGRICADNAAEIKNMIQKIINYQDHPVIDDAAKILLLGEKLYDDPLSYGSDYLQLLIGHSNKNGYTTYGYPTNLNYSFLFEKDQYWDADVLIPLLNQGFNFVNHDGHSNFNAVMKIRFERVSDAEFAALDGKQHLNPVIYSHGCNAAGIDWTSSGGKDCIAEEFLALENFAVAFIGNTRYGWFNEGQTDGPSTHLQREFVDALYNPLFGDRLTRIGAAHTMSRIKTAPFLAAPDEWEPGAQRWCFYGCSILGDPALELWTYFINQFAQIDFPDSIPDTQSDLLIQTCEPAACVTIANADSQFLTQIADASGAVRFSQLSLEAETKLRLKITKHNFMPVEETIYVIPGAISGIQGSPQLTIPKKVKLDAAFPNPFNSSTRIRFELPEPGQVRLAIFNTRGQMVEIIENREFDAGLHSIQWNALNQTGVSLASGIYFIQLKHSQGIETGRCVLIR